MSYNFYGAQPYEQSGSAFASAGDIDGDGLDDILIGSANGTSKDGTTYVVFSSMLAHLDLADGVLDQAIDLNLLASSGSGYVIFGSFASDDGNTGFAVSSAGDVDNDGVDDILIGGYRANANGVDSGIAYLLSGADLEAMDTAGGGANDNRIDLSQIAGSGGYAFIGASSADYAGTEVVSLGDVDGDFLDDFVITATHADDGAANAGAAYLVRGADLATLDHDGDGLIDLGDIGAVDGDGDGSYGGYLIAGNLGSGFLGNAITTMSDLDGDGARELVVTAFEAGVGGSRTGVTYILLSSRLDDIDSADGDADGSINLSHVAAGGYRLRGGVQGERMGTSVSVVPDFDGDGVDDLIIGGPRATVDGETNAGRVYLVSGAQLDEMDAEDGADGTVNLAFVTSHGGYVLEGEETDHYAGTSVAGISDFDGDNRGEIAIGAPRADGIRLRTGIAYVIRADELQSLDNADGSLDRVIDLGHVGTVGGFALRGQSLDSGVGSAISSVGDVDGDGKGDFMIAAPLEDLGGRDSAGRSQLVLGKTLGDKPPGTIDLTDVPICFVRGTRIATDRGERPVEDLRTGDLVATADAGLQPVRWIGRTLRRAAGTMAPVRIAAGTLGNHRDLWVSPQHRMLLRRDDGTEAFAPAIHLVDGRDIVQVAGGEVEYFHLMCSNHQVIFAEGAPTESFFPGPQAWKTLTPEARAELRDLFPELEPAAACKVPGRPGPGAVPGFGTLARPVLRRRETQRLAG